MKICGVYLGPLCHPHELEEGPVIHRHGPSYLSKVGGPGPLLLFLMLAELKSFDFLLNSLYAILEVVISSPWP